MKTRLAVVGIFGLFVSLSGAQQYVPLAPGRPAAADNVAPGMSKADQVAYLSLNRREIESNAQLELLNQLAQEHKKRAEEAARDQAPKAQWESDLAKELGERAAAILIVLTNTTKDRSVFEQSHPELAASGLSTFGSGATNGPNPAEMAFLTKLAERRTAILQEIAATTEAANLYATQVATNSNNTSYDASRLSAQIQENGYYLKQLQKELFDLDLKNLEFRALTKR